MNANSAAGEGGGDRRAGRRRLAPERSRQQILDAATALVAEHGPDAVTLAQVAAAAGVTRGLVSHYFGTHRGLVREVLRAEDARHRERVRARVADDAGVPYAARMLDVVFATLDDERYLRLWAWSALHPEHGTLATDGLAGIADMMEAGLRAALPADRVPSRDRIEAVLLLGMSGAYGYALGGRSWQSALGHDPDDAARSAAFRSALSAAVAAYLVGEETA
ncbi:TetR/AcrR family transcriptional regulator [Isoptericola sp. NPDC057191]|uniref:TetR/AcrR family transcriptional regulator n=1 Tax=Isoptericola sp. NPDC057191 TaxID=3346041 RepID=UPI003642BC7D